MRLLIKPDGTSTRNLSIADPDATRNSIGEESPKEVDDGLGNPSVISPDNVGKIVKVAFEPKEARVEAAIEDQRFLHSRVP